MVDSMDELEERVRNRLYRMRDFAEELAAVRGRETSDDGTVTAEVDGNGALVDLRLSSGISRLTAEQFERVLVRTTTAAARSAFERRGVLVTAFNEEITA
ncbi:hypothetical protein BOX37_03975 [Nocardia mangyaensis]|uniref:YbaB/EbfC DNA-binding family protein n=2 Tax=Nocardia mangyaensis TaxID=2213200 RepID=A0A1J0VMM2_9NOCA|nr:hypothetical protein BOX37_03975 [Nocardia mangyaensis]